MLVTTGRTEKKDQRQSLKQCVIQPATWLDVFGDRWHGEIQWNNVPEQHELNKFVIKFVRSLVLR